jgi:hypothetical protein
MTTRIVFPTTDFPTVAQAVCTCGWEGPCRDVSRPGPRGYTEGEATAHDRRCRSTS